MQTSFNNLLADYTELGRFCHEVREGAKTEQIIEDEVAKLRSNLDMPESEIQATQIRDIAREFKEIVIAIDENSESVSVEERVQGLLSELRNAEAPNSPSIQELKPFLEALHGIPVGCALKRFRNFFTAPQVTPHFSKCIEVKKDLSKCGVEVKADALLSLKNPSKFQNDIKFLARLNLLDEETLSEIRHHSNPHLFIEGLIQKKWDEEVAKKEDGAVELVKELFDDDHFNHPKLALLKRILDIKSSWNTLYGTLKNHPDLLAPLNAYISKRKIQSIWNEIIVPQNQEIEYLAHIRNSSAIDSTMLANENHFPNLIKKYRDNPQALAVIFRFVIPKVRMQIWDEFIAENNLKIEFLLQVDMPGAFDKYSMNEFLSISKGKRFDAFLKKNQQHGKGLAAIFKILNPIPQAKLWDEFIAENNLETEFLSLINPHEYRRIHNMLFIKKHKWSEQSRKGELLAKYKDDSKAQALFKQIRLID